MKASNINKCVIRITKYRYIYALLLIILIPTAYAGLSGSLSIEAITKRLEPMGKVTVDAVAPATDQPTVGAGGPKDIYEKNCKMCHQTGLAGAPKLGSKADWAPRVAQGMDVLLKNAWNGIRAMPPKGNCLQCTEEDIRATIQYILDSSK